MRKITFGLLVLLLSSVPGFSQVILINPAAEGGFENGATFADNGWTVVNPTGQNTNRRWYLGTGQAGYTGARAAFIGNNTTTVGNPTGQRTVHFYRSITLPADAQNIVLTFKYKQAVSDFVEGTYYDYVQVTTSTAAPANGNLPAGTVHFGPYPSVNVPQFTTQTVTLPNTLAGTTRNLIFTYKCDNIADHGYGAVDDISLTYDLPAAECTAPQNPELGLITSSSAEISWDLADEMPEGGYDYFIPENSAEFPDENTEPNGNISTNSIELDALEAGMEYTVWIRTNCGGGLTSEWIPITFTTSCGAPGNPVALDVTMTSVTISWDTPNEMPDGGYDYFMPEDNSEIPGDDTEPDGNITTGTEIMPVGLSAGTTYVIWIRANCANGNLSEWVPVGFTTLCEPSDLPFQTGFEESDMNGCLQYADINTMSTWSVYMDGGTGVNTGTNSIVYAGNDVFGANNWFFIRGLNLTGGEAYSLSFRYKSAGGSTSFEDLEVNYGTSPDIESMGTEALLSLTGISSNEEDPFSTAQISFTPETSGVYYIGFHCISAAAQGLLYVDDITVTQALSVANNKSAGLTAFPNPVRDVLTLSSTTSISQIIVYNMLGQQVLSVTANSSNTQLDVSALQAGSYLVKITSGEESETIKIIKQ